MAKLSKYQRQVIVNSIATQKREIAQGYRPQTVTADCSDQAWRKAQQRRLDIDVEALRMHGYAADGTKLTK